MYLWPREYGDRLSFDAGGHFKMIVMLPINVFLVTELFLKHACMFNFILSITIVSYKIIIYKYFHAAL